MTEIIYTHEGVADGVIDARGEGDAVTLGVGVRLVHCCESSAH